MSTVGYMSWLLLAEPLKVIPFPIQRTENVRTAPHHRSLGSIPAVISL